MTRELEGLPFDYTPEAASRQREICRALVGLEDIRRRFIEEPEPEIVMEFKLH